MVGLTPLIALAVQAASQDATTDTDRVNPRAIRCC